MAQFKYFLTVIFILYGLFLLVSPRFFDLDTSINFFFKTFPFILLTIIVLTIIENRHSKVWFEHNPSMVRSPSWRPLTWQGWLIYLVYLGLMGSALVAAFILYTLYAVSLYIVILFVFVALVVLSLLFDFIAAKKGRGRGDKKR